MASSAVVGGEGAVGVAQVRGVRLYLTGGEVQSRVRFKCEAGANRFRVVHVAKSLSASSVRIATSGDAFSVMSSSFDPSFELSDSMMQAPPAYAALERKAEALRELIAADREEETAIAAGLEVLKSNRALPSQEGSSSADQLQRFCDVHLGMTRDLQGRQRAVRARREGREEELRGLEKQLADYDIVPGKRVPSLDVTVYAATAGECVLEVTYLTDRLRWSPMYEIVSSTSGEPLEFRLRGLVTQRSGLDLSQVAVELVYGEAMGEESVLDPGVQLLTLATAVRPVRRGLGGGAYEPEMMMVRSVSYDAAVESNGASELKQESFEYRDGGSVTQVSNALRKHYRVDRRYDLPSGDQPLVIPLGITRVPAEYEYCGWPSFRESAYLEARISNAQGYDLLPAEAKVIHQNSLVGETYIDPFSQEGPLKLSLGSDARISLRRDRVKDMLDRNLVGTQRERVVEYELVVRNNQDGGVWVVVEDRVPVSGDDRVRVELYEVSGADHDRDRGRLSWTFELPSGSERRVRVGYRVRYPSKEVLVGL